MAESTICDTPGGGRSSLSFAGALLVGCLAWTAPAAGQMEDVEALTPRILFTISGGFWEDAGEAPDAAEDETATDDGEAPAAGGRGYYRAIAYRAEDDTSRLYLQQIALGEEGPEVLETTEIEAITALSGYITDMRPENSTGISAAPGFAAFIYIKQDPEVVQPEMLELFVDEFGEITVGGASN